MMGMDLLQRGRKEIFEMKAVFYIMIRMIVTKVFVKIHPIIYLEMAAFSYVYIPFQ